MTRWHLRGTITRNQCLSVCLPDCQIRTQRFYTLKKLHKDPPQVRPTVSGCSGPTEAISRIVDHHLQPIVQGTASYLKDTASFLRVINQTPIREEDLLVTIDVKSLYTSIPHDRGIETACRYLDSHYDNQRLTETMECLMKHILHNIEFNEHHFAQVKGTATGTRMAPAYAGLFMARLEEDFLAAQDEETHSSLVLWKRFIDDIVAVWRGGMDSLRRFLDRLDNSDSDIKYTWTVDYTRINYLDVDVFKERRFKETGLFDTRTHIKETNSFQYVHASSSHPPSVFKGVVIGETTRLRNTTDNDEFYRDAAALARKFTARGYSRQRVSRWTGTVLPRDRETVLRGALKKSDNTPNFITQYTGTERHPLRELMTRHCNIVQEDSEAGRAFPCQPRITYRRCANIKDLLVRAKL